MSRTPTLSVAAVPVRAGVRLIALSQLDEASSARERMFRARDDEALHDFRVALRRLRSGLRAYRPYFDDSVRKADRRALRDIARATGDARDIEVQLAWLAEAQLDAAAVPGADLLGEHLNVLRKPAERAAARAIHRFPDAAQRVRRRLSRFTDTVEPKSRYHQESSASVAAVVASGLLDDLRTHMSGVATPENAQAVHDARIGGKRLRYLLEPFRDDVANGRTTIALLRDFQDAFGELHDLDVMFTLIGIQAAALSGPGHAADRASLERLTESLRPRREEQLGQLRDTWLDGAAEGLYSEIESFTAELARIAPAQELEIERKFLLRSLPRRRKDRTVLRIDQGWLPGDRVQERLRRVRGPDGTRWYRTVKVGYGLSRAEYEEEITEALFRQLWPVTRGRRISKRRYVFRDGQRTWEVDRFLDRDLVLAEIELRSADDDGTPPPWLASHVVREVTGNRDYQNVNLAG